MQATLTDDHIANLSDPRRDKRTDIGPANDLCTAEEPAQFLQLSVGFIYKPARQNRIPSIRIESSVRFDIGAIDQALRK